MQVAGCLDWYATARQLLEGMPNVESRSMRVVVSQYRREEGCSHAGSCELFTSGIAKGDREGGCVKSRRDGEQNRGRGRAEGGEVEGGDVG